MAVSTETKIEVLIDKLTVLLEQDGGFASMSTVDRKLMQQYVAELNQHLAVLLGAIHTAVAQGSHLPTNIPVASSTRPPEPRPPGSLSEEVMRELAEVKVNQARFERTVEERPAPEAAVRSSVNDRFANESRADLTDRLKRMPISSLRTGINLNDRLWFAKELFKGNTEAYDSLVSKLEAAGGFDQAKRILDDLVRTTGLDPKRQSVAKFINLVERRFMTSA